MNQQTRAVVIGAGPAGMTVANLLLRAGIDCIVLEARDKTYVTDRQRAGVLDHHSLSVYEEAGIADEIVGDIPPDAMQELRMDGESYVWDMSESAGRSGRSVPQQLVLQRLLSTYLDNGGDIRFEARDVAIHDLETDAPRVTYRDPDGTEHQVTCAFIAGCDGHHGVSRRSIPEEELTTYSFDHGIGWYTLLADAPAPKYPLLSISCHGFAAQFPRGPKASRFYLQYWLEDDPREWADEFVWQQLRLRLNDPSIGGVPFTGREIVEMRSHVTEPMSYRQLFLVGDAAHIITPMGAKGMNLAIADAAVLARAIIATERHGDQEALARYSPTCLRRTWDHQEFSRWYTEMMHDAGDDSRAGPFRRKLAQARARRLMTSQTARAMFDDLYVGTQMVPTDAMGRPV